MTEKGVKAEFEALASKISRLEALRDELDALDVRGFESEARLIRARLKDVHALPELEREMNELRRKIKSRDSQKESRSLAVANESQVLKRKIQEIEKLITKKKNVSVKKQLSKDDVTFVHDIPDLERQLSQLRKQFSNHVHSAKVHVDSGVGVLVDSKFDDFVNELKSKLSVRLREKEHAMDDTLKHELAEQQQELKKRYSGLVNEFHTKYRQKVEHELKKAVDQRLHARVQERLLTERRALLANLSRENMKRLETERRKLSERLDASHRTQMHLLQDKLKNVAERERRVAAEKKRYAIEHQALMHHYTISKKKHAALVHNQQQRLHSELAHAAEVERNAKSQLQKRMASLKSQLEHTRKERVRLQAASAHVEALREQAHKKLINQENLLAHQKDRIKKALVSELHRMREKQKAELAEKSNVLENHIIALKKHDERNSLALDKKRKQLSKEFEMLKARYRFKMLHHEKSLHSKIVALKTREQKEYDSLAQQRALVQKKLARLDKIKELQRLKLASQERAIEARLNVELQKKVAAQLKERERAFRKRLQQEYALKFRTELQRRSAEFDRRKVELEQHIINQAKRFFK